MFHIINVSIIPFPTAFLGTTFKRAAPGYRVYYNMHISKHSIASLRLKILPHSLSRVKFILTFAKIDHPTRAVARNRCHTKPKIVNRQQDDALNLDTITRFHQEHSVDQNGFIVVI